MRQLQRIIYQETRAPIFITLLVLTFVVFTREFGRLAEVLIRKNAETATVGQAIVYLLPSILIFTVPFAFLIGTLIGFSRLAADSEIIAMRAGGVSVYQILWPVLKMGAVVAVITAALTLVLLPRGNWELRMLRHEVQLLPMYSQIKPRVFFEEFPDIILYVEDLDLQAAEWKGIFVADHSVEDERRIILAQRGRVLAGEDTRRAQLHFENGTIYSNLAESPEKMTVSRFGTLDLPVEFEWSEPQEEKERRPRDKTLAMLLSDLRQGDSESRREALVELNRRTALPLSGFIFAVLAVTLGIRAQPKGRGHGFLISIVIAFTYYVVFATGSTLSRTGVLPTWIGVWGANILTTFLALFALRYSDRSFGLLQRFQNLGPVQAAFRTALRLQSFLQNRIQSLRRFWREKVWRTPSIRFRLTRVVDLYMVRLFLLNLMATLLVCLCLVYLFTFFEIIDEIFQNDIPYSILIDYFFFLLPHFLMLLVPISVLIATLITFGTLQKSNQVVAFTSCGVSVYRIGLPVFILGIAIAGFIFVMQEYVLPYANVRQDNLRNIIKGKPVQTIQPGRHWIFGEGSRLYNYHLYRSQTNSFSDLSVYHLDLDESRLTAMTRASRAHWDGEIQSWLLRDGWTRSFDEQAFDRFQQQPFQYPETPDFFDEEVRDSSKMTYLELRRYISNLQTGGFEVGYLKTELYKKLSFPFVNFFMALLGLPFALTMGRKGAFYGIGAGVLLGIAYWGAFGIFDVLGSNGLLAPMLAAWGPNLVFGTGAAFLLSTVRT